jgi:mutator protein MutT
VDVRVHVALAVVDEEGRWLVGRRSPGRIFASLWEFPGGKLLPGESAEQAAVRETREETGLTVEPLADLGQIETCHGGRTVVLHLIHCRRVAGEPQPSDPAVDEVRWVTAAELRALPMPPANADVIARLPADDPQPG